MIIFEENSLLVKACIPTGAALDVFVVTFTGRENNPPVSHGSAERFFLKNRIPALHFISKANHWWHSGDFLPALDRVRGELARYGAQQIVTYGSSMGGYGALVAAPRLGAVRAVVSVPQASVDPVDVPWETRWRKDIKRIDFRHRVGPELGAVDVYAIFDPFFAIDRMHVDVLRRYAHVHEIHTPFAEHGASMLLKEVNLLEPVTLGAIYGKRGIGTEIRLQMRQRRGASPLAMGGAANALAVGGRKQASLRFGRRAFELILRVGENDLRADHNRMVIAHFERLLQTGLVDELHEMLDRWAARTPPGADEHRLRAGAYFSRRRIPEALEAIRASLDLRRTDKRALSQLAAILEAMPDSGEVKRLREAYKTAFAAHAKVAARVSRLDGREGPAV